MAKNTQIATANEDRVAALRKQAGGESGAAVWPAKASVNRKPLASDDTPLPMGKYTVTVDKQQLFFDTLDVIVMTKGTQYMHFTGKGDYVGCTMIENSYNPAYLDSTGRERLGRVPKMEYDDMSTSQKEVKFYFRLIGVADISKAVDAHGKKVYDSKEPIWHPIAFQFGGKNSVEKQNEFKKIHKRDEGYFDFITHLPAAFKDGDIAGVPYYGFHLERGDDVVLTDELLDSIEAAQMLIENENKRIYNLYLEAQAQGNDSGELTSLELPQEEDE